MGPGWERLAPTLCSHPGPPPHQGGQRAPGSIHGPWPVLTQCPTSSFLALVSILFLGRPPRSPLQGSAKCHGRMLTRAQAPAPPSAGRQWVVHGLLCPGDVLYSAQRDSPILPPPEAPTKKPHTTDQCKRGLLRSCPQIQMLRSQLEPKVAWSQTQPTLSPRLAWQQEDTQIARQLCSWQGTE